MKKYIVTISFIFRLFLGGVIPGLLIGFGLMLVTYFYAKKRGYPSEKRASLSELLKSFLDSLIVDLPSSTAGK